MSDRSKPDLESSWKLGGASDPAGAVRAVCGPPAAVSTLWDGEEGC